MKSMALLSLLLAFVFAVGCKPSATTPSGDSTPPSSPTDAVDQSAEPAADDAADVTSDAREGLTDTTPDVDEVVGESTTDTELGEAAADADTLGQAAEPAQLTQADYERQLMAAVQNQDMVKALEVVDAALVDFPQDIGMQVNRFLLHLRLDAEQESKDPAAAADGFIQTAALARELMEQGDRLPPQGQRVIPYAFFNEARGFAYQGKVAESLTSLRAAVEGGLDQLEFPQDDFFASIRDNEEFKAGVEELKTVVRERMRADAQREIDEAESFDFDFELPDLEKNPIKLADFKGKLVIVDIWGTWCPPCREEIPHFIKLKDAYADDLAIVGINYEDGEGDEVVEKVRQFASERGMNYPCVIGDQATQDQVPNLQGFPTTLFLDREGKVRLKVVGYHPYEKLEAYINVLLSEGQSDSAGQADAADGASG